MNSYFNITFYPIYEFILLRKLLLVSKLKEKLLFLDKKTFLLILTNYYLLWENIFKINFNFKYKNKKNKNLIKKKFNRKNKENLTFFSFMSMYKKNFLIYFFFNNFKTISKFIFCVVTYFLNLNKLSIFFLNIYKKTIGDGFFFIRGLVIIFFIDACVTDDEPLWEPIEWSLVQTWILFIFIFAWIAENLITSRYGSYTGRDKRVWLAWYKTFWLIEAFYALCYGATALFVITPFYYELTYNLSFIFSWWNWYTKIFFFKFISIYTIVLLIANYFLLNIRWMNWKKLVFLITLINFFIAYLLYTHFIMAFFAYFTDPLWYQKTRPIDYIQLSHEPLKWGWGPAKRDHFTYHKVSTVFWYKNDTPFAGAFFMFHLFFFLSIFFLYIYWLVLLRRTYATREVSYTFAVYCVSSLKQFYYFFLLLFILIIMSFVISYWRFPIEFIWLINSNSWFLHFFQILKDYVFFLF